MNLNQNIARRAFNVVCDISFLFGNLKKKQLSIKAHFVENGHTGCIVVSAK